MKRKFTLSGKLAFDIYSTYGLPLEIIEDIVSERHWYVETTMTEEQVNKLFNDNLRRLMGL